MTDLQTEVSDLRDSGLLSYEDVTSHPLEKLSLSQGVERLLSRGNSKPEITERELCSQDLWDGKMLVWISESSQKKKLASHDSSCL